MQLSIEPSRRLAICAAKLNERNGKCQNVELSISTTKYAVSPVKTIHQDTIQIRSYDSCSIILNFTQRRAFQKHIARTTETKFQKQRAAVQSPKSSRKAEEQSFSHTCQRRIQQKEQVQHLAMSQVQRRESMV